MKTKLLNGDNIELLKNLPDNSVDSVITDPPYGLSFMNKKWDHQVPSVDFWKEVYRVLKPGGHVLSFGGTRTYHRMTVNIEDAGFEIRDQIMWLYGSGFPKSHNIGKSVDKIRGNEREGGSVSKREIDGNSYQGNKERYDVEPSKGTSEWEGWGTALKPANEPICVARKPLSEKTVALNVLKWGTGGINIDGCRVEADNKMIEHLEKYGNGYGGDGTSMFGTNKETKIYGSTEGRFPANIILDEEAGMALDEQSGESKSSKSNMKSAQSGNNDGRYNWNNGDKNNFESVRGHNDKGGASRFFYCPKVSKKERNAGCDELEDKVIEGRDAGQDERAVAFKKRPTPTKNIHPTVKPISLMAYLVRLVTPPNGIVLDPFMGSGSTGCAAVKEGFRFCGMEMDEEYFKIATKRIEHHVRTK